MVGHTASFVLLETSSPILTRCKMRGRAVFMSDTAFGERDVLPLQPSSFLIWAERYLLHYAAGRPAGGSRSGAREGPSADHGRGPPPVVNAFRVVAACPQCGGQLDIIDGCPTCRGCGYSKCL